MAWRITIHAGPHTRRQCPVRIALPAEAAVSEIAAVPLDSPAVHNGVGQLAPGRNGGATLRFVVSELEAGSELQLTVDPDRRADAEIGGVTIDASNPHAVAVRIGGAPFTTLMAAPAGVRPFFYPVYGPDGTAVTRHYPMKQGVPGESEDHRHHRSFYVAHGDINGEDVWSETEGHGSQTQDEVLSALSGPVAGVLETRNTWRAADGRPLMTDLRRFEFYNVGPELRLLDARLEFRADFGPVVFGDTKEGGLLTFRVAGSMKGAAGGCIENAWGGIGEAECWGQAAPWVDYAGPVGDTILGIAVMDHPMNLRFPTRWHVRDYGLFAVNPFALSYYKAGFERDGTVRIESGDELVFHYRVLIHRGGTHEARVGAHFLDYVQPPRATAESL
ncbi:MAG: hypothetical protein GXP31_06765 [Kiritimatiellaeota bacterium]|nr:hypothetical protein [Kiritimatiellota bacterium]